MPTKPLIGLYLWASDINYSTGPAPLIGTATKITPPLAESDEGWNADQKPPAQWENFSVNLITQWTEWLRLGVNTAAADAHVVETDSAGTISAVEIVAGTHKQSGSGLGIFGDGSDGTFTTAGSIVLARATYYANLTVSSGDVVTTNGFPLFVKDQLTLVDGTSIIEHNGAPGTNANGGPGIGGAGAVDGSLFGGVIGRNGVTNANGLNGTSLADSIGADGGAGGDTTSNTGGATGAAAAPLATDGGFRHLPAALGHIFGIAGGVAAVNGIKGGAGGGSGASEVAGSHSGGAGGGGGVVVVAAQKITNAGIIRANGGNAGTAAGAGEAGGSGGGGGGGVIVISREIAGAGTIVAAGGTASSGINGAANGVAGTAGTVLQLEN